MTNTNSRPHASVGDEEAQSIDLLQWAVTSTDDEVIVMLAGEVDLSTGATLGELLRGALEAKPARVVVDLAQVSFLDSTGIHTLLTAAQAADDVGCTLTVRNPTDIVMRVLTICGVDETLLGDPDSDRDEAATKS
jgi:anti-anti-sigma factor